MKFKNIDFKSIRIIIILVLFVLGLIYVTTYKHIHLVETFELNNKCPNLLVKKGNELHLVNTKKALIPGVNPIIFKSLDINDTSAEEFNLKASILEEIEKQLDNKLKTYKKELNNIIKKPFIMYITGF